ncbi:MAG TPA: glycosyltransferase [Bacteroidales bacterium]|nr:glycosyltransferase [Bacteroidales bacterium]
MKETADITVLAANYNNGPYLQEFIRSILASEVLPRCILIVDDGSTDASRAILEGYRKDPRFDIVLLEHNEGFARALNHGLDRVSTSYILRADPDDILLPGRIGTQWRFLEAHPELSGVGCNVEYVESGSGRRILGSNFPSGPGAVDRAYRKGQHGMQHPTVMLRSAALGGVRYHQETVPAEDYDLFARLVAAGCRFDNIRGILYRMRIHERSASSNLKFTTIHKTFRLRKEIFGKDTPWLKQFIYFLHMRAYRNGLLAGNRPGRYAWFLVSALLRPASLLERLMKQRKDHPA